MSTITRRLSILTVLAAAACTEEPTTPIDTGDDTGTDTSSNIEEREVFYAQASINFGYDASTGDVTSPMVPGSEYPSMMTQVVVFDTTLQSAQSDLDVQNAIMCLLVDVSQAPAVDTSGVDSLMNVELGNLAFAETSATGYADCRSTLTGDDLATLQALLDDGMQVSVTAGVDAEAVDSLRDAVASMVVVGAVASEGEDTGDTGASEDTGDTGASEDTGDTAAPEDSGIVAAAAAAAAFEVLDSASVDPADVFITNDLTFQGTTVGMGYGYSFMLDEAGDVAVDEAGAPYVQHRSLYMDEQGQFTSGLLSLQFTLDWNFLKSMAQ